MRGLPDFGRITLCCHCEPVRAWQSSLRRYAGCRGRCGGRPDGSAGLPRRYAPRNDNAKTWGMLKRSLDCRVAALLAMTKGRTGMGQVMRVLLFGRIPCAVIGSPVGRGNQVSSLLCHCEEGLEEN